MIGGTSSPQSVRHVRVVGRHQFNTDFTIWRKKAKKKKGLKSNILMPYRGKIAVCFEKYEKHKSVLCEQKGEFLLLNLVVKRQTLDFKG
jgi:hypothetical protein